MGLTYVPIYVIMGHNTKGKDYVEKKRDVGGCGLQLGDASQCGIASCGLCACWKIRSDFKNFGRRGLTNTDAMVKFTV